MEMFDYTNATDITIVERDVPEPYLSFKKHLTEILQDETIPYRHKREVEKQMFELDKHIVTWLVSQPISIILKRGKK